MAGDNVAQREDVGPERDNLHRQAHYQIEAMCSAMLDAAKSQNSNTLETLPYLVQSLSIRIDALNGAMMNTVGSDDDDLIQALRIEVTHV